MPDVRDSYLSKLENFERQASPGAAGWLKTLRHSAIERFAELGFPTPRQEDWKYTNVASIASLPFERLAPADLPAIAPSKLKEWLGGPAENRLVFLNGRYASDLSSLSPLSAGVRVGSLREEIARRPDELSAQLTRRANYQEHAFAALNTAFLDDGALIRLPPDSSLDQPIHLVFASSAKGTSHPRVLILAGARSRATVIESYWGTGGDSYFTNALSEIVLGEGAAIEHYKLQNEAEAASHIGLIQVEQGRSSRFESHSFSLGGGLARNELRVTLDGEGAECVLNGLYLAGGTQHLDNTTQIDHAKPHCKSRQLYKGILDGRSRAVFNGRILVRPDAQKTDAQQTNNNLLLSDEAEVDTKPQLAIYADDVKCAHGATVGQLDEEAMFYLRSRGLPLDLAGSLLTFAFASEMIALIGPESLRSQIRHQVASRLPAGKVLGEL
jgi:Fe-S cluster assembly protein SufD